MKIKKIISLVLAMATISGGLVNSSTAAVTSKDYSKEELDSSSYDVRKYTDYFWEGNIVYNEIVFPIRDSSGKLKPFELMYDATEIISVKSYRLDVTYQEGEDYLLLDGDLYIRPAGTIPVQPYSFIHPATAPNGYGADEFSPYYPHADGVGYEYWTGGQDVCEKALAVTYIHNDTWKAPIPESQESRLPGIMKKLMNREAATIVVAGDSVSTGAMGSGFLGMPPFADAYPEMTANALREKFGNVNIKLVNSAIGGTMSHFDETKMNNTIINHSPDLVIINFGMNDSSCDRVGIPGEEFKANIKQQIDYIKEKLPTCEVLLVSSLYGNRYTFPAERYEEHAALLHVIADEYEGVGVADPQKIEKYLIEETGKDFVDFMADNMVHPGDLGMRLMTQTILAALDVGDIPAYRKLLIDQMTKYADPDNHIDDGKKDELLDIIDKARDDIADIDIEWDINEIITEAYEKLDFILGRCAFEDHVFKHTIIDPTCKEDGFVHSICEICGYEYDHDFMNALGGEHIMDNGRLTTSPTYKISGIKTYTCAKCGYEEYESIPMYSDPPVLENKGMLHINNSYNYMEGQGRPYADGSGFVEFDFCPLSIDVDGTPYVGVWFTRYAVTACYNFRKQQVEIIETSLPYGAGSPFITAKYDWAPDNGEYDYNWKKFTVKISGATHTVEIYIDGELILSDTNPLYTATNEVPLVYSVGEYYMDNVKVGSGDYDPATGTGGTILGSWDLDSEESLNSFWNKWGNSYSKITYVHPDAANVSTGKSIHSHVASYYNTVEKTCAQSGYQEFICDICSELVRLNHKAPSEENGHKLINKHLMLAPTAQTSGRFSYECEHCFMTFIEKIPMGYGVDGMPVIIGDVNVNGKIDVSDIIYLKRFLAGAEISIDINRGDLNADGKITAVDCTLLQRKFVGSAA
ncbi:MAG: hypothetical protein E7578_05300 [Ruminococcaceae bacterium]|nr:hypothetical protein [Oscillospiraceae bacterium]